EMLQLGHPKVSNREWKAGVPPTIGRVPAEAREERPALVGDHLSAFSWARLLDRCLKPSSFRLVKATLAILLRCSGIAGVKRAKLRQNPCRLAARDLGDTRSLTVEGQTLGRTTEKGHELQMPPDDLLGPGEVEHAPRPLPLEEAVKKAVQSVFQRRG